ATSAQMVEPTIAVLVALQRAVDASKEATTTIPIVTLLNEPVETGLVASLGRPGGNITGPAWVSAELASKRLALLKEAIPKAAHVTVLWNPTNQREPRHGNGTQPPA